MKLKNLLTQQYTVADAWPRAVRDHCAGSLFLSTRGLTSLKGSPETCGGAFSVSHNELETLEFAPKKIDDDFYCQGNKLTSLKGGPEWVGNDYSCFDNVLTSLEGAPSHIGGNFDASSNKLTSLKDIHKRVKFIGGTAEFVNNPITSHVLGLLRIAGLTEIGLSNQEVTDILNKHLAGDRDIFACQEELVNAGFEEYAQL